MVNYVWEIHRTVLLKIPLISLYLSRIHVVMSGLLSSSVYQTSKPNSSSRE